MTNLSLIPKTHGTAPGRGDPWLREVDQLFDRFLGGRSLPTLFATGRESAGFVPAVDIREHDDRFELSAEVPGFSSEQLSVDVTGDTLTLRGQMETQEERGEGDLLRRESRRESFQRSFRLGTEVDVENVQAKLRDGVLHLTVPKLRGTVHRRIEVTDEG